MEKEEFLEAYARRSGVTKEFLASHGRVVSECHCGDEICPGWQMGFVNNENDD